MSFVTRISFISAVRDESAHITEMVDSWSRQSDETELIVIDDHSSDDTAAIVLQLAKERPNLTFLSLAEHGEQRGKVAAFNLGLKAAGGDFLGFFGGDDVMPLGSVMTWLRAISPYSSHDRVAAFGKCRTMSDDPRRSGVVIPRGNKGNRIGGTSLFSRGLADLVTPIPSHLPSEDTWTSFLLEILADEVIDIADVVTDYRIHAGNSNPRNLPFNQMSTRMASRHQAYVEIREHKAHLLAPSDLARVDGLVELERARQTANPIAVMGVRQVTLKERIRALSMTTPALWTTRQRFFKALSGW